MSKLLDIFEVGEEFGTQADQHTFGHYAPIRTWRISKDGTPVEVKAKENK